MISLSTNSLHFRKKHSSGIKDFWVNNPLAEEYKGRYRDLRGEESLRKNPWVEKRCGFCNQIFSSREKEKKNTCSQSCSTKLAWREGRIVYKNDAKEAYRTKMINYAKILNLSEKTGDKLFKEKVALAKEKGLIPKHFGLSSKTIKKYFNTFNDFIKEVVNG